MKFYLIISAFVLMCTMVTMGSDTLKVTREKFDLSRDPEKDLAAAVDIAEKSGKRILLDVGGEWCIWCHRLDDFLHKDVEIDSILSNNFIIVKVNFSPENQNKKFLKNYPKIDGYPHMFVLEKDGKLLHSQNTGDLESGKSYSREKVIAFLKEWSLHK